MLYAACTHSLSYVYVAAIYRPGHFLWDAQYVIHFAVHWNVRSVPLIVLTVYIALPHNLPIYTCVLLGSNVGIWMHASIYLGMSGLVQWSGGHKWVYVLLQVIICFLFFYSTWQYIVVP